MNIFIRSDKSGNAAFRLVLTTSILTPVITADNYVATQNVFPFALLLFLKIPPAPLNITYSDRDCRCAQNPVWIILCVLQQKLELLARR